MVNAAYRRPVTRWLTACALMVALMVLAGGYTRLTGSGLSITEWKPVHGIIPPFSAEGWQDEFAAYRATPQYAIINEGITVEEFKHIFWPEFIHRLLGRVAGLVFFAPFAWFVFRRAFSAGFTVRMMGIFALGGLQGAMGWYMVKSGLLVGPYVSHIRLAMHLMLAFLIFGLLLWTALGINPRPPQEPLPRRLKYELTSLTSLFCVQVFYGALLAGMHGGLIYNTFPTMNGRWLPEDLTTINPLWENLLYNIACVQFIHRWLAMIVAAGVFLWWLESRRYATHPAIGRLRNGIAVTVLVQVVLGVTTLTLQVPLLLATLHQLTALLLFTLLLTAMHRIKARHHVTTFNQLSAEMV